MIKKLKSYIYEDSAPTEQITTFCPKVLRKTISGLKHRRNQLKLKILVDNLMQNELQKIEMEIVDLEKQLDKLHLIKTRIGNIDRQNDISQIKHYENTLDNGIFPDAEKASKYLDIRKKALIEKLNAPDEVLCSDMKIRTRKEAETFRVFGHNNNHASENLAKVNSTHSTSSQDKAHHQEMEIQMLNASIEATQRSIEETKEDVVTLNENRQSVEGTGIVAPFTIEGEIFTNQNEAGKAFVEACKNIKKSLSKAGVIGNYRGFDLIAVFDPSNQGFACIVSGKMIYSLDLVNDGAKNVTLINNVIEQIPRNLAKLETRLLYFQEQLEILKAKPAKRHPLASKIIKTRTWPDEQKNTPWRHLLNSPISSAIRHELRERKNEMSKRVYVTEKMADSAGLSSLHLASIDTSALAEYTYMSNDARALYALLLDNINTNDMNATQENHCHVEEKPRKKLRGGYDEKGHAYVYYQLLDIQKLLDIPFDNLFSALDELSFHHLIETTNPKNGEGKTSKIFPLTPCTCSNRYICQNKKH